MMNFFGLINTTNNIFILILPAVHTPFSTDELNSKVFILHLKQSHIFLLVSCLETFGLVYLEAMASGNMVIGSRGEGIDGIIQHEKNGFLSPAGELEPLTAILEQIIFQLQENQLEDILVNAHHTINQYTNKIAAQNYMNQLVQIIRPQSEDNKKLLRGVQKMEDRKLGR